MAMFVFKYSLCLGSVTNLKAKLHVQLNPPHNSYFPAPFAMRSTLLVVTFVVIVVQLLTVKPKNRKCPHCIFNPFESL